MKRDFIYKEGVTVTTSSVYVRIDPLTYINNFKKIVINS